MEGLSGHRTTLRLWRAVEAQHVISTMLLVDSSEEQRVLEDLLEDGKPPVPEPLAGLHYLLFTPFRYPPTAQGSRFRRPGDPGVFYGADQVRTACAELGYWRWRFLMDSPDLESLDPAAQTVFQVVVAGAAIDLREPPLSRRRSAWTDPADYRECQQLATAARDARIQIIRYESVRDPEHGGAAAVLSAAAFRSRTPEAETTWYLAVRRDGARWSEGPGHGFEFRYSK